MKHTELVFASFLLVLFPGTADAQAPAASSEASRKSATAANVLDAQSEKRAVQVLFKTVARDVIAAAEAMPAVKYSFAPTDGEFKDVRTFGQQVKHLAATNHILAAAALGEQPPADAGDEMGPETVRSKSEILEYLNASFAHLAKAIDAIGQTNDTAKPSPISPLRMKPTPSALIAEALIHSFNHYGQMVVYLRMNGVVPPASLPGGAASALGAASRP